MILTCPECATSYFVDDARIPPEGRKVKCASCGARWMSNDDQPTGEPSPIAPDAPSIEAAREPEPEPAASGDTEVFGDLEAAPVVEPQTHVRRRPPTPTLRAPERPRPSPLLFVGVAVAVASILVMAAVVLRAYVMKAVPASKAVYAAVGLGPSAHGLAIEGVRSRAIFQGEAPVLSVTGSLRNVGKDVAVAGPMSLRLIDKSGDVVAIRHVTPAPAEVPAGATRYFSVIVPDPPAASASLEIDFDDHAAPKAPEAARHEAPVAEAGRHD